jgi:hypothetical protein
MRLEKLLCREKSTECILLSVEFSREIPEESPIVFYDNRSL